MFTPRSVHTPQPTDNLEGNGVAQWTVNERFASLEVRRAELDEYLAKLQTIVDVSCIEVMLHRCVHKGTPTAPAVAE